MAEETKKTEGAAKIETEQKYNPASMIEKVSKQIAREVGLEIENEKKTQNEQEVEQVIEQEEREEQKEQEAQNEKEKLDKINEMIKGLIDEKEKDEINIDELSEEELANMDVKEIKKIVNEAKKIKKEFEIRREAELFDEKLSQLSEDEQKIIEPILEKILKSDIYNNLAGLDLEKRVDIIILAARGAVSDKIAEIKAKAKANYKKITSPVDTKTGDKIDSEEEKLKKLKEAALKGDERALLELQKQSKIVKKLSEEYNKH